MFALLRKLGKHVREREGATELDQLSQPLGEDYRVGLAICFDESGDFRGVVQTQGQDDILYKFGSPRGNDYTLVSRTSATTENVVPRLSRNANKIIDWGDQDDETIQLIQRCHKTAQEFEDEVIRAVVDAYPEDASTEKRVFAYWALVNGDKLEPFCQTDTVKEFLADAVLDSYAERSAANVRMQESDGTCAVCGDLDVVVYGNFSDIACYNVDKRGFITGGFSYGQTTRNFPVCRSCILAVRGGREYAEAQLDFYGAGLNYWLLPEATEDNVYRALLDKVEGKNRESLGGEAEGLMSAEEGILDYIAHALEDGADGHRAWLNFFFYESSNAAWRIVGEMRRVLPSRITEVYRAKEDVERRSTVRLSDDEDAYWFNIPRLQPFCGAFDSQDDRKLLRYLEAIFQENPLGERTVVNDLVHGILDAQKEAQGGGGFATARYHVRDAWAIYLFLDEIGSLDRPDRGDSVTIDFDEDNSYTDYIEEHKRFLDTPEKVAAFLTGCYVGQVLYGQYQENPDRDTQPFTKKFTGRKLDRKRLLKLYNEGRDKLEQYGRRKLVLELEPVHAEAWAQTGEEWPLSDEETTFAFNLGATMSRKLATRNIDTTMEATP